MPAKSPTLAVDAYVGPLQKSLSLICKGVLVATNRKELDTISVLGLADAAVPVSGRSDLYISFAQHYMIIKDPENGPFRVKTAYYKYTLETKDADEIIGYHWHPSGISPIKYAHLHLGAAAEIGRLELIKAHLPTGRVAFEDFVEFLVGAFDVSTTHDGWRGILSKTREKFFAHKSW